MYLFHEDAMAPFLPHDPQKHGFPCDYLGGDEGIGVRQDEYALFRRFTQTAIFLHYSTGAYCPAVQVGQPSACPVGNSWQQAQAHLMVPTATAKGQFDVAIGPFTFYDLVAILEVGLVPPEEAASHGYFGEALYGLRGRIRALFCPTEQEAMRILVPLNEASAVAF